MSKHTYVLAISKDREKLSQRSEEVIVIGMDFKPVAETSAVISDLKDTLRANKDLVCLSAPQLNHFDRIFCIKFADGDIRAFINPMISKTEGLHLTRERCASIPNKEYIVPRHDKIIAIYQTPTGRPEQNIFEGVVAEIFQQMVNMLDGVLIDDFGLEVLPEFDNASAEEQEEVLKWYLEELKKKDIKLQEEIEADDTLRQTRDAINFMKGVASGEITIEANDDVKKEEDKVEK